jgi:hypothetical protein
MDALKRDFEIRGQARCRSCGKTRELIGEELHWNRAASATRSRTEIEVRSATRRRRRRIRQVAALYARPFRIVTGGFASVVAHEFNSIYYPTGNPNETVMGKSMSNASAWAVGAVIGVIVLSTSVGGGVNAQSPKNSPPISNSPPVGAPGGRFQMLIIPPNSNSYGPNDVVILDTQEGDLWKWYQYGGYPNSPENSSAIMYLGRAKPGAKPGDVVDKYAHPATPSAGQTQGAPKDRRP